ncbi:MAG: V-type ATP synthase subunit E [Clostridia bacterium]|nr:V-type ATP synthase subunit E [Clostridia bacterium]
MSSQALIDKIISAAEAEAEQITNEILRRAGENEKLMLDKADADCSGIAAAANEKSEQIKRIAELTSGLEARKARLHARRTVLDEAFGAAYKKVLELDGDKRSDFIRSLIVKYSPSNDVRVLLSEADLPVAEGMKAELEAALSEKFGAPANVCFKADAKIDGGVYMSSERSDVDATLGAIFGELRERYEAEADAVLFGGAGNGNG